jgi:hypothetical protein
LDYRGRDRDRGWDADFRDSQWVVDLNAAAEEAFRTRVLKKNPAPAGDSEEEKIALAEKIEAEAKKKQICITDIANRASIINLFRDHLHWHPITHGRLIPSQSMAYLKKAWEQQVWAMHERCRELGEQWAWEYLWTHWLPLPSRSANK